MTTQRPAVDSLAVMLGLLSLAAAAAAAAGEFLQRAGIGLVPGPVAVLDASLAWLFMAWAVVRAAITRIEYESRRERVALKRLVVGVAVLFVCQALVAPIGQWVDPRAAFVVDVVGTIAVLPAVVAGVLGLCWPPGLSRNQRRVLIADAIVGGMGIVVLWGVLVVPRALALAGDSSGWALANALFMYLAALLLLVLVAVARRRAQLPARRLLLIHASVALFLLGGLLDLLVPRTGAVTELRVFHLAGVLSGALLLVFLLYRGSDIETPVEARVREVYAALGPLVPIPLAAAALIGSIAAARREPSTADVLGGLLLILVLLSIVVLRALASAELRGAARERAGAQLHSSTEEEWFQILVGRTTDLTLVLRRDGTIAYCTPSLQRATGLGPGELKGREFATLLSHGGDSREVVLRLMGAADARPGQPTDPVDLVLVGRAGSPREVEWEFTALVGLDLDGYLVNGRDVTDERRMQALLAESESRDTLTGLHTRSGFLAATDGRNGRRCVLVINLRRFADYNDRYGHAVGDNLLRQVAQVLQSLPPTVSEPARLSADTFAVMVAGSVPDIEAVATAASLREALQLISLPDGRPAPLDLAAGYAVADARGVDNAVLLSRAELAMMRSRSLDRSPLVRYDPTLSLAREAAAEAEADLRSALRERTLVVRYQPIVRLADGVVVAAEALVRRQRADGSLEPPNVFIPLAERLGLVDEVDYAVLMRALSEMRQVAQAIGRPLPVSVNISASELDDGLEHRVIDALASTGWQAEHLIIEITETALALRADEAGHLLRRLRRLGCHIAMDDFGTGYSSMAGLVDLPVDIVKIDASFTARLTASGRGLAVMRAIVELGRSLDLVTVAEGLATIEQADLLRGMGCDRGQGYLYAPPLTAQELVEHLRPGTAIIGVD